MLLDIPFLAFFGPVIKYLTMCDTLDNTINIRNGNADGKG